MPQWLQTIFVALILLAALAFVCRQILSTLAGRRSKLGSCCAKGCTPQEKPAPKVAFIPSELLIRRK